VHAVALLRRFWGRWRTIDFPGGKNEGTLAQMAWNDAEGNESGVIA